MRAFQILFFLFTSSYLYAQSYQFKSYTLDNGLPTEIIKSIAQDSSGYFWIATDEGLVKFDGIQFTSYRSALRSQYAKGFRLTSSGRLLLFGDLDLVEINNQIDTVYFTTLLKGARNLADSTLWYPKSVYEDVHAGLWISEPQSVVKYEQGKMHRYMFDAKERSPQFLRSFNFFEDRAGHLFTTSIAGTVFQFSATENTFTEYAHHFTGQVWDVAVIDHRLYIGSSEGLYIADLLPEGGFTPPVLKYAIKKISSLQLLTDNRLFIGTSETRHFLYSLDESNLEALPFSFNNVNQAYASGEHDLWLSTNEGIYLVQENLIKDAARDVGFIESIARDSAQSKVYFANMKNLYEIDTLPGDRYSAPEVIFSFPNGYFQDLKVAHQGVWAANSFSVLFLQGNKVKKQFNFESEGRFVADLCHDSKNQIWFSQHNQQYAMMIDASFKLKKIRVPVKPGNNINLIREGPDGMYIGSSGKEGYLFFKADQDSLFRNISLPVTFKTTGDFNVSDLTFSNGLIYLATTEGIVRYDHRKVEQIDLGESLTGLPSKTIENYLNGSLLFSTAKGLVRYDPALKEYWLYDESTGMNSNTITTRGLHVDHQSRVWIGTSKGLCYTTRSLIRNLQTPQPGIISLGVNGIPVRFTQSPEIRYGSFLELSVSSVTFPENKVTVQYRMNENEKWQTITNTRITLSKLKSGSHTIEMRAKKAGGYDWSGLTHYTFKILPPFWQQSWFIIMSFIIAMMIAFLSITLANIQNTRRSVQLQKRIDERTHELKLSNEELSQRNNELDRFVYSASHDLSAPLKSILGLITITRMDNPSAQTGQYLTMMETSVRKLDSFINDVVNYSRNARLPVKQEVIVFKKFIESIWSDYQYLPLAKKIRLEIRDELKQELITDDVRLKIIFNNLISNGIKFHLTEKQEEAYLRIIARDTPSSFEFIIEDNGQGIADALKDKIFDMFFRATQNTPGSGLGLYILKETIVRLGGTVSVESELGKGTTFTIRLPKKTETVQSK